MPAPRSVDLLVKVARLYYLDNLSQSAVARELGLSTSSVSRILAAARDQGVVEIRIHDPGTLAQVPDLERALRHGFGIQSATVVQRPRGSTALDVVAAATARRFEQRAPHLTTLGLSWGITVDRFVDEVRVEPIHSALEICPLVGGLPSEAGPAANRSLEVLAQKSGATSFRFDAPSVVESPQTWAALSRESMVTNALARAAGVQEAFVGIGSYNLHNSVRVVDAMRMSDEERAEFARQRPAGDICGRFYDQQGRELGLPTTQRVIGISLNQLRDIPHVLGIAAGAEKAPGVAGALRCGALDSILLDEDLARAVLKLAE